MFVCDRCSGDVHKCVWWMYMCMDVCIGYMWYNVLMICKWMCAVFVMIQWCTENVCILTANSCVHIHAKYDILSMLYLFTQVLFTPLVYVSIKYLYELLQEASTIQAIKPHNKAHFSVIPSLHIT